MADRPEMYKIVVYAPIECSDAVRAALAQSGAGTQGNYDSCSFSVRGIGRFRPLKGAHPTIGSVDKLEEVHEEAISTFCTKEKLLEVVTAIKAAHPYEEPVIDIMPLGTLE